MANTDRFALSALRLVGVWCAEARRLEAPDVFQPSLLPVYVALTAALVRATREALDALAAAIRTYAERACG